MRLAVLRPLVAIAASAALAATAPAAPAGANLSEPNRHIAFAHVSPADQEHLCTFGPLPRDVLTGVSTTSASNAWAVGCYLTTTDTSKSLILHRNRTAWSRVKNVPSPSSTDNELLGVTATSAANAWAVGYYFTGNNHALILHWNGSTKTWSKANIRKLPSTGSTLAAVTATSASNAWAVGTATNRALILHWNGTAWSPVGVKKFPSTENHLAGVTATSARNAWAVGYYFPGPSAKAMILHWNGTVWSRVGLKNLPSAPSQLSAVTAASATSAWAVGQSCTSVNTCKTLILHWNGTAWSQVRKPAPPSPSRLLNDLNGARATTAANAWAVGQFTGPTDLDVALIVHWNGTAWSRVDVKNLPSASNDLAAVSASSAANAWAVGISCTNAACSTSKTLIVGWNGTAWKRVNSPNPSAARGGGR